MSVENRISSVHSAVLILTFDLGLCRGAILKTDRVTYKCSELALHLLADSFRDRHCCHTTGLRTADEAISAIAVFIQELCELRCLS
jgi:hypothetical protein